MPPCVSQGWISQFSLLWLGFWWTWEEWNGLLTTVGATFVFKRNKNYFWHENVRSVEQSIVTIGIHLSSLELWQQDNLCINPVRPDSLALKASHDPVQEQRTNHMNQKEAKRCSYAASSSSADDLQDTCCIYNHSDSQMDLRDWSCPPAVPSLNWAPGGADDTWDALLQQTLLTARMTSMKGGYPNPWWGEEGQSSACCSGKMTAALESFWHL